MHPLTRRRDPFPRRLIRANIIGFLSCTCSSYSVVLVRVSWRMTKVVVWVLFIAFLVGGNVLSRWLAGRLGIHYGYVMFALILSASAALSGVIEVQRRTFRRRFERMPPQQKELLRKVIPEIRCTQTPKDGRLSARVATRIGSVWVNWPIIAWVVVPVFLYQGLVSGPNAWISVMLLIVGFACAWSWWSVNVTLWRRWAARRGVDLDELQWRGEGASILWPKGHFFDRTEIGNVIERIRQRKVCLCTLIKMCCGSG